MNTPLEGSASSVPMVPHNSNVAVRPIPATARAGDFIRLVDLPLALAEHGVGTSYQSLRNRGNGGEFPIYAFAGKLMVLRQDLPEIAALMSRRKPRTRPSRPNASDAS